MIRRFCLNQAGAYEGVFELSEDDKMIGTASEFIQISNFYKTAFKKLKDFDGDYNELQDRLASGKATKRDMELVKSKNKENQLIDTDLVKKEKKIEKQVQLS